MLLQPASGKRVLLEVSTLELSRQDQSEKIKIIQTGQSVSEQCSQDQHWVEVALVCRQLKWQAQVEPQRQFPSNHPLVQAIYFHKKLI